ncbi:hypothetical protein YC2023_054263 [Brassica napus]
MASIPSSPSERRLKQPRKLTLSVLTASISSYLFFSVRKLIETTTEIDSLGPHHGINSVFSLLLCQKTDLFNFEITSQVVNVWNFGSVFLVCILGGKDQNEEPKTSYLLEVFRPDEESMARFAQFDLDSPDCLMCGPAPKGALPFGQSRPACHQLSRVPHLLLQRSRDHTLSFLVP